MRLFAIPNQSDSDEARVEREAELLWSVARRESADSPSPEIQPLMELSEAVRDANDSIDAYALAEARDCFTNTHGRLMQVIAASRPLPGESSQEQKLSNSGGTGRLRPLHFRLPSLNVLKLPRIMGVPMMLQGAAFAACMLAGVVLGRHNAHQEAPFLPVTEIVADFDRRVNSSGLSDNATLESPSLLAAGLSSQVGVKVQLPDPDKVGAQLLGVRTTQYDGVPTVEANFVKDGTSLVYFQAKAPQRSLRFVQEKRLGDKVFMVRDLGKYRVVAWRNDDSVLAIVSPLNSDDSLVLASAMRESAQNQEAA